MDTGDGRNKMSKKPKLFKEKSESSSKRWLRSDGKKSLDKFGASTGNTLVGGEKKVKIDKDEKSADGGCKKRKLSTTEHETSPKRSLRSGKKRLNETGQSDVSKENPDGVEMKAKIDKGKGKKRKLFSTADGSEIPSKRPLHGDHTEHLDNVVAKGSGELSNFNLPVELLVKIIEMVPISQWASLESVSRNFKEVVHGLWGEQRNIRLDELTYNKEKKPYHVMESVLKKFLIRAPNVASIGGFAEFCGRSIGLPKIRLLSKFKHLQTIEFSGQRVVPVENFAVFLESSASRQCWKSLDIYGGICCGTLESHKAVGKKNQPALNLEYFKFSEYKLSNFGRFLPIQWSGLKKLVVVGRFTSAKKILSLIRQCTQLERLEIDLPICGKSPSYGDFMQCVADLVNLSGLKIEGHLWLNDAFAQALLVLIQDLGRRLTDLALELYDCNDQILGAIIDHLPCLKSLKLDVSLCTKPLVERLANEMTQLESLKLQSRKSLDGTVVRAIGGNMVDLQCLHLDYSGGNSKDFASLGNLRRLKDLRVLGIHMDCGTIKSWTRLGFGSALETVELYPRGISSEVMGKFIKKMPRLHSVNLRAVTDAVLYDIAISCSMLVELNLCYSSSITAAGIQAVIDRCTQLKYLKVVGHSEWFPAALTVGIYRKMTFKSKFNE